MSDTGDPRRMAAEMRKEDRDARECQALVPFQQVEFFTQHVETRYALYRPSIAMTASSITEPAALTQPLVGQDSEDVTACESSCEGCSCVPAKGENPAETIMVGET
jgi:hypothetical protein